MFCNNCGAQNPDTSAFCSGCGAPLNNPQQTAQTFQNVSAIQPQKPKNNKGLIIGIVAGVVALIAIVGVVLAFVLGGDKDSGDTKSDKNLTENTKSKEFTTEGMTADEVVLKVAELLFYGEYDELENYLLIKDMSDLYVAMAKAGELDSINNMYHNGNDKSDCSPSFSIYESYEVSAEDIAAESGLDYGTDEDMNQLFRDSLQEWLDSLAEEFELSGFDPDLSNIYYDKISKGYYADVEIDTEYPDGYQNGGEAVIYLYEYDGRWVCFFAFIDM
ncbi:MAG: zinc-ribbon domain-containing protein [Candidatus Fimenecus sp.]